MNILVLYHSRNGHTQNAADFLADAVRDLKHEVIVKSVTEVNQTDVAKADVLFIGTWVHGLILFGVRPAGAELWVPSLPSLKGKPVGVFCTYAFNPRGSLHTLGHLLAAKGAVILGQHAFHRNRIHEGVAQFVQSILQSALSQNAA